MKKEILWICIYIVISFSNIQAQENLRLSLNDVVALAQSDAPDVLIEQTRLRNNYWRYQSFLADFKPQINFDATLPKLERSHLSYLAITGETVFIRQSTLGTNAGIRISQDIPLTGGSVYVGTDFQQNYNFKTDTNPSSFSYFTNPFYIGFRQSIFGFNAMKWRKKIEPLRFEESNRAYAENMEAVAYNAARLFFTNYLSQLNLEAAQQSKANADTLYTITQGRFSVGKIAETELLQIELNAMRANAVLAEAKLNLQTATEALRNFLGIQNTVVFDFIPPTEIPNFQINEDDALKHAKNNRKESIEFKRRLMEVEQDLAQVKGETGINIDLQGSFGFSRSSDFLSDAYGTPYEDQERITLGIQIPIADWGKTKSKHKIAESNLELEQMIIEQQQTNLEKEIQLKVNQFDLIRNQVALALRTYEVSQKRQDITRKRYFIGKIGIIDLNLAIREEEETRRSYMSALRNFWLSYYELRGLTLYDFENQKPLLKKIIDF